MSKPSWDDAPEWAQWLAQDQDGSWWWFEWAPQRQQEAWNFGGKAQIAKGEFLDWEESLEARP